MTWHPSGQVFRTSKLAAVTKIELLQLLERLQRLEGACDEGHECELASFGTRNLAPVKLIFLAKTEPDNFSSFSCTKERKGPRSPAQNVKTLSTGNSHLEAFYSPSKSNTSDLSTHVAARDRLNRKSRGWPETHPSWVTTHRSGVFYPQNSTSPNQVQSNRSKSRAGRAILDAS